MASTYSSLKIQLMATGENSGTWGNVTNDNLGIALEEAIVGSEDVTFASANVTLTLTNTNASQTARNLRLNLVGTTGGARDLIVPAIEKIYIVNNTCADAVTIKVTGQTGVAVPAGKTMYVYNTGTDCTDAITHLRNLTLATALPVASGGTGSNTATFSGANITSLNASSISSGTLDAGRLPTTGVNANTITAGILAVGQGGTGSTTLTAENVIIGNTTGAVKFVAPGSSGNVLTSNGTAWTSAPAAAGGGDYAMTVYTNPATWTKPANIKAVKVTVIGGGGGAYNGGGSNPISSNPGGTSSFGPFMSATGGGGSPYSPSGVSNGNPGNGTSGDINRSGTNVKKINLGGCTSPFMFMALAFGGMSGQGTIANGEPGGSSAINGNPYGGGGLSSTTNGGGAGGYAQGDIDAPAIPGPVTVTVGSGGTGAPTGNQPEFKASGAAGVVIVEEFY
jgi:hypothetical protein